MLSLLHDILIGGAIFIIVVIGLLLAFTSLAELIFGGDNYRNVAQELRATKTGDNLYEVTLDGERFAFGDNSSSRGIKSVRRYFFVSMAFGGTGYLGLYDRRSEMYGADCHPDATACFSGDAAFDAMFLIQSENAAFASAMLASAPKRETLRRLRDAGFAEILFNDDRNRPVRSQSLTVRISHSDGKTVFNTDDATPSLIRRAAKMLRELQST